MIDEVISVCHRNDLEAWRAAAPAIVAHIRARTYTLVVPAADLDLFRRYSPPQFEVIDEDLLIGGWRTRLVERFRAAGHAERAGWYLQQLIKLAALERATGEYLLLWDADTVPIRDITPFSAAGEPIVYRGRTQHETYVATTEALVGPVRRNGFSFVAQCLPVRRSWFAAFVETIATRSGGDWREAVLAAFNPEHSAAFSEYEALGLFFFTRYGTEMRVARRRWFRYGGSLFGGASDFTAARRARLAPLFDFVSFEKWDIRRKPLRALRLRLLALPWLAARLSPNGTDPMPR